MTVAAEEYMEPHIVIDRNDGIYTSNQSVLIDQNDDTCIPTKWADKTLQAVFRFPNISTSQQMSMEVILKNSTGCGSPSWTWFVESECNVNSFMECSGNPVNTSNDLISLCEITCECFLTCDYLYFKYSRMPLGRGDNSDICEVRVLSDGNIEPSADLPET